MVKTGSVNVAGSFAQRAKIAMQNAIPPTKSMCRLDVFLNVPSVLNHDYISEPVFGTPYGFGKGMMISVLSKAKSEA
jgi:hypothetical protein